MSMLALLASLTAASTVLIWILCLLLLKRPDFKPDELLQPDKKVAVLLAARNEEANLEACLNHLLDQDYPKHQYKIFIGDDQSSDRTLEIARDFADRFPERIIVLSIRENRGRARGKANVLAQLADAASAWAEYFCITDADVRVPESWVSTLLQQVNPQTGTISATTVVSANSLWGSLQRADWLLALGMAKAYAHFPVVGKPVTAIGNNMLVPAAVYQQTGGYAHIPFSITEDLALMKQAEQLGYTNSLLARPGSCAETLPAPDLASLLHQRKRWMTGAMQLPWFMVVLLFIQAFFYPAILVALWFSGWVGLSIWALKVFLQAMLINRFSGLLAEKQLPPHVLVLHELYSLLLSSSLLVFYVLPVPIRWKGRYYKDNTHEIR